MSKDAWAVSAAPKEALGEMLEAIGLIGSRAHSTGQERRLDEGDGRDRGSGWSLFFLFSGGGAKDIFSFGGETRLLRKFFFFQGLTLQMRSLDSGFKRSWRGIVFDRFWGGV